MAAGYTSFGLENCHEKSARVHAELCCPVLSGFGAVASPADSQIRTDADIPSDRKGSENRGRGEGHICSERERGSGIGGC